MIRLKIGAFVRKLLYAVLATSWCTGVLFFIFNTWIRIDGQYGPQRHPLQFTALSLHGGAAFLMMIIFGALLAAHMPFGWRSRRNRIVGSLLVAMIGVQIITAYLLYYLANEIFREFVVWFHLGIGLCLPLALYMHIASGRSGSNGKSENDGSRSE